MRYGRPKKLNPRAIHAVARAYHAGVRPSELAQDWNISPSLVIAYARKYEQRNAERASRIAAKRQREFQFAQTVEKRCPEIRELTSAIGRELGIRAITGKVVNRIMLGSAPLKDGTDVVEISIPYVEFQHRR